MLLFPKHEGNGSCVKVYPLELSNIYLLMCVDVCFIFQPRLDQEFIRGSENTQGLAFANFMLKVEHINNK